MSVRNGLENAMCIQSERTCSGQVSSGQSQAGGRLMGWSARARKAYNRPKRHN